MTTDKDQKIIKQIDDDLRWREDELAAMKLLAVKSVPNSISSRVLLRAMLALLYAHYEGFSKFAWDSYLDAIEHHGGLRAKHIESLAAFSCEGEFSMMKGNLTNVNLFCFYSRFSSIMNTPISFPPDKLSTKYNLEPETFFDRMEILGIDCHAMKDNKKTIAKVVGRRHEIAHGKFHDIKGVAKYVEYENAILSVMYELAINITEAIENKSYLKP